MPKGRGAKGRRGGRKKAETRPVEEDTAVETDLNSSSPANVSEVELIEDDQDVHECTNVEHADEEVSSLKNLTAKQTLECNAGLNNDTNAEEGKTGDVLNKEEGSEEMEVGKCLDAINRTNHVEDKLKDDNILEVKEGIKTQETELFITGGKQEAQQLETVIPESSNIENVGTKVVAEAKEVDKKTDDDDVQLIAKKDNDLPPLDVSIHHNKTAAVISNELGKQITAEETGNTVDSDETHKTAPAELIIPSVIESKQDEGLENSKFEEISEGSIEQAEQDDLNTEPISDVEITGEAYETGGAESSKDDSDVSKEKLEVLYQHSEATAKNKDNDDISDASLPDQVDADLSLEEISEDDLEPSKKRRKSSGQSPVKADNGGKDSENLNPNVENTIRPDATLEKVKIDNLNVNAQKHAVSEDSDDSQPSSVKRMKLSDDKTDTEELSSKDDKEPTFSTGIGNVLKNQEEKSQKYVAGTDRNPVQSSKNWRQESTDKSSLSRDLVPLNRKHDLVDASCQSEPRLLKGKIVQCNINPIKTTAEINKREISHESDPIVVELLNNLKHKLPSRIPDQILADVIYLQSSKKKGIYSFSMGPLSLSDIHNSMFKDVLSRTESFSLGFDNHSQGLFKATFSKLDYTASLFTWLNHQELGSHCKLVSFLYSGEMDKNSCVWKAILLHVKEQGIQSESELDKEETAVKLYLNGVPKGVSTTFINLLFPAAQNVVIDPESSSGLITLDFSSSKMLEKVWSSYGLLVINGSQISMSRTKSQSEQRNANLPTEANKKSDTFIKKDAEHKGEQVVRNLDQEANEDSQQKKVVETSKKHESCEQLQQVIQNEITSNLKKDEVSLTLSDTLQDGERKISVLSDQDSSLSAEKLTAEKSVLKDGATENKITVEQVAVEVNEFKEEVDPEALEKIISDSAGRIDKDVSSNITEEISKQEAGVQDKMIFEVKEDDSASSEEKIVDKVKESVSDETSVGTKVSKQENDETLVKAIIDDEDDDKVVSHKKKHEEVIAETLREDLLNKGIINENLGNELETNLRRKSDDLMKAGDTEKSAEDSIGQKSDSQLRESDDAKTDVPSSNSEECVDSKLVMTDGGLEVSMEVINVNGEDGEEEKVIYPRTWQSSQGKTTDNSSYFTITRKVNMGAYSSYASKSGIYRGQQGQYKGNLTEAANKPRTLSHLYPYSPRKESPRDPIIESTTTQRRDQFPSKHRSRSPSPGRDKDRQSYNYTSDRHRTNEQWSKSYESQQPGIFGDSRRTETYSKPVVESRGGPGDLQSRIDDQHAKPSRHSLDRDLLYAEQRRDDKKLRSDSLSKMSDSSDLQILASRKSPYRRGSPKHPVLHASRSPISTSSRSRSLSPISKSPSPDLDDTGTEKDELVKTVHHFLKLAKGLQQTKKRHHGRPKSSRLSSSRRSPHRASRSPYMKRSRSPQPARSRSSKSPTYIRSSRYKYDRSPSPISHRDDHKRHHGDHSSDKRSDPYLKESSGSRSYDRSQRSGDFPFEELIGRSQPSKWPEPKYSEQFRSSNDQPWQQSHGTYKPLSSGPVSTSNIFNPSCPPPGCPPQEVKTGTYPGSSMPMYQYSSQPQYNFPKIPTNIPPPFIPPIPPSTAFPPPPFQPAYSLYPPRF